MAPLVSGDVMDLCLGDPPAGSSASWLLLPESTQAPNLMTSMVYFVLPATLRLFRIISLSGSSLDLEPRASSATPASQLESACFDS